MGRRREGGSGDKAGEGGKEDRRTRGPEDWRITKIQVAGGGLGWQVAGID
jgi:hypothetical protein